MFTSVPNHYLTAFDVFSLSDLENIENGELFRLIHPLVQYGQLHIENCEVNLFSFLLLNHFFIFILKGTFFLIVFLFLRHTHSQRSEFN